MRIFLLFVIVNIISCLNLYGSSGQYVANSINTQDIVEETRLFYDSSNHEIVINNSFDGNYIVQVFNLTGTEVLRKDVLKSTNTHIAASQLRNGVYLVRVSPVKNQPSATFKIMVK